MAMRDTFCTVEAKDLVLKRPIRGACFEFWFNRYQTFVAAIVAICGAAWTVAAMKHQTRTETNRVLRMNYLHIVSELRLCRDRMADAYSDASAFGTPFDNGTRIPTLSFNKDPKNIGEIPADEALLLFLAADGIDEEIGWLNADHDQQPDDYAWDKEQTAALLFLELEGLISVFAPKVGLYPTSELRLSGPGFERAVEKAKRRNERRREPNDVLPGIPNAPPTMTD
ncbi:hypothetical protein [Bosea sp. AK1]|uniref:hypothetical protein n=1 Tax=Bosea sp. AK1 TaxID=2587160 RepID=UPI001AEE2B97|nr:hypothetical protein [Bosea sp. AK1]